VLCVWQVDVVVSPGTHVSEAASKFSQKLNYVNLVRAVL